MSELEKQWNSAMADYMRELDGAPQREDALVTALRAENARLREELAATYARIEHCISVVTRLLDERQPHAALRGDNAP